MGFWVWFAIWSALAIGAIAVFGAIGYELFNKAQANFHQLQRLEKLVEPLQRSLSEKPVAERPAESLLNPGHALVNRKQLIKRREQKAQDRQRRLINRLHDLKFDESRFR